MSEFIQERVRQILTAHSSREEKERQLQALVPAGVLNLEFSALEKASPAELEQMKGALKIVAAIQLLAKQELRKRL